MFYYQIENKKIRLFKPLNVVAGNQYALKSTLAALKSLRSYLYSKDYLYLFYLRSVHMTKEMSNHKTSQHN